MSYLKSITATLMLLGAGNAHMIMKTPTPYGAGSIDNSPLTSANYPCKAPATGADTFYSRSAVTKMAIGEKQTLSFTGSAVHGGGSCQLAITSDLKPSKSTHWEVILSIEGGCPSIADPANPSTYDYAIPMGITPGQYSFSWSWISKESGNGEFYQNCAGIEVTAPKSKRFVNASMEMDSLVKRSALPDLFVGNIAGLTDCKSVPSSDPLYPDPGDTVVKPAGNRNYQKIVGSNCCPEGKCQGGGANSPSCASSSSSLSTSSSSIDTGGAVVSPVSSNGVAQSTSVVVDAQISAIASGFASGEATSSASTAAATSSSSVATSSIAPSSTSAATSLSVIPIASAPSGSNTASAASSTYASTMSTAVVSSQPASTAATSQSSSTTLNTSGGLTGPCTTEGIFNCVSSQYQQCASGAWTVLRPLAAGTQCKPGQSMGLWAKRSEGGAFHRRRGSN